MNASPTVAWGSAIYPTSEVTAVTYTSPDATLTIRDIPYASYRGPAAMLSIVATLPGAVLDPSSGSIDFPMSRASLLAFESFVPLDRATRKYKDARSLLLDAASRDPRFTYPAPHPGQPAPWNYQVNALYDFWSTLQDSRLSPFGYGYYLDQGSGKTRLVCDTIRLLTDTFAPPHAPPGEPINTVFVLAQKIATGQWEETLLSSGFPSSHVFRLTGSVEDRKKLLLKQHRLASQQLSRGAPPFVFLLNWEVYARMGMDTLPFDVGILDEAHRMKDPRTQWARSLHRASKNTRFRINMTGTPVGESAADLYSQCRWLTPPLFGSSYQQFVEDYCIKGGWQGKQIVGVQPDKRMELVTKMYSCAFRITKATATDMPPKQYVRVALKPSPDQARAYRDLSEESFLQRVADDGTPLILSVDNALTRSLRLMQVTAGFVPTNAASTTASATASKYIDFHSAKTDYLCDFITEKLEEDPSVKFLVWTRFRHENDRVYAAIAEVITPSKVAATKGGSKDEERDRIRRAFNDRTSPLSVWVMQVQTGAQSLDVPSTDYVVYHTQTLSGIERMQSEDRGHRSGRSRPYFVIDLVLKGTVDIGANRAARAKKDLAALITTEGFTRDLERDTPTVGEVIEIT